MHVTEEFDEDFNLNELDDQELVTQMHDDLYDGLKDEIEQRQIRSDLKDPG